MGKRCVYDFKFFTAVWYSSFAFVIKLVHGMHNILASLKKPLEFIVKGSKMFYPPVFALHLFPFFPCSKNLKKRSITHKDFIDVNI